MPTIHSNNDPVLAARNSDIQFPLPTSTALGAAIKNLDTIIRNHPFCAGLNDRDLRAKINLRSRASSEQHDDYRNFLADIFKDVHEEFCVKDLKLADVKLEQADILYLIANPVGHIIRRPFIAAHYAAVAAKEVPIDNEPNALKARDLLLDSIRKFGFSRFVSDEVMTFIATRYPERDVWVSPDRCIKSFTELAEASRHEIWNYCSELRAHAGRYQDQHVDIEAGLFNVESKRADRGPGDRLFYSDPEHAFNIYETVDIFKGLANRHVKTELAQMRLLKPQSVLMIEDNQFYAYALYLYTNCEDLKPFVEIDPVSGSGDRSITHEDVLKSKGIFTSAEEALSVIDPMIKAGQVPDLVLADIELGNGMNGLEFIRILKERCDAVGKKINIIFISSSNMSFYADEVQRLKDEGIIKGAYKKSDFNLVKMIHAINENLAAEAAQD